jgi:hypothetical protein
MFERFGTAYHLTPIEARPRGAWRDERLLAATGYAEFAERFAGCTFDNGLYRCHDEASGPRGYQLIADAFPELAGKVCPFAFDWYGRQFAVDSRRRPAGEPLLLLIDPTTGAAYQVPHPFVAFHDQMLVDEPDEAVAREYFVQWARAHPSALPLRPDQCVGPQLPLSLGGSDAVDALELTDMEVHWSLHGQFWRGTRGRPEGTRVGRTVIEG